MPFFSGASTRLDLDSALNGAQVAGPRRIPMSYGFRQVLAQSSLTLTLSPTAAAYDPS